MKRWLLAITLFCGCNHPDGEPQKGRLGKSVVGGEVVSTVDAHPVLLRDVLQERASSGGTLRESLEAVQANLLLSLEAERRGYGLMPSVMREAARAAAQRVLIRDVEDAVALTAVPQQDVVEFYEKHKPRFVSSARRGSLHYLVLLPENASKEEEANAKAEVERVRPFLEKTEDPSSFIMAFHRRKRGMKTVAETVPPLAKDAKADQAYLDALFRLDHMGSVSQPVRTSYGFHVIRWTSEIPAVDRSYENAKGEIMSSLVVPLREKRAEEVFDQLAKRIEIYRPADVSTILSQLNMDALNSP